MAVVKVLSQKANNTPVKSIYTFGERNSGTNYVNSLIMNNCVATGPKRCLYDAKNKGAFGWKHGFPMMLAAPDDVLAIAVYREPISWLQSLCRAPWHTAPHLRGLPFSQFIRSEWMSIIDDHGFGIMENDPLWKAELMSDRDPLTGKRFANAMRLRNAKNRGFATLDNRFGNVLRVNYETVLANPEGFLNALCSKYGFLRLRKFDHIEHDRATPCRGVFQAKPVAPVSDADMNFIAQELDIQGEADLGYDLRVMA